MKNTSIREAKIVSLKTKLIDNYVINLTIVFVFYVVYFALFLHYSFMVYYVLGGMFLVNFSWFALKKYFKIESFIRIYLAVAPLFCLVVILLFWNITVTNFMWLISVPIGAFVFFNKRALILYSIYTIAVVSFIPIIAYYIDLDYPQFDSVDIRISDMFIILSNIYIVTNVLYYNDKIRALQVITQIEVREKIELPVTLEKIDLEQYESLFIKIDALMKEKELFKNPEINISVFSAMLKVSASYVSRAIRYKEYPNFNSYINEYRINYVVKLIDSTDLEKLTLLYVYTEAGYKNQSTFNTAFKKIKGITPSEYIQNLKLQA